MLVFNCTKAAAEFFTTTRQGNKISVLQPAPYPTIAESVKNTLSFGNAAPKKSSDFQWHWMVHCVSIKRKKYLLVMECHSRLCLTILASKKGDVNSFLDDFNTMLQASFYSLAREEGLYEDDIEKCLDHYHSTITTCAFHPRVDLSVLAHIKDAQWHLERICYEDHILTQDFELMAFNVFIAEMPRKTKDRKTHFFPKKDFIGCWKRWAKVNDRSI